MADALEEAIEHMLPLAADAFTIGDALKRMHEGEYRTRCLRNVTERLHAACASLPLGRSGAPSPPHHPVCSSLLTTPCALPSSPPRVLPRVPRGADDVAVRWPSTY